LYFFLTNILIFGLADGTGQDLFGQFRSILAGEQGTLLQLGIGPIVTASIVLQLLGGSGILGLDTNDPRDQQLYQGLQKALVLVMILLTGIPMVFSNAFLPADASLASSLGLSVFGLQVLMFLQIAFGGVLILYMDEVVSKWGVGSGIGLFIIAGVSQRLVGGIFSELIPSWVGIITGDIKLNPFTSNGFWTLITGPGALLAVATTVTIFIAVVYFESTRIEIPLSNARVKGARGRFPVKLIYASVLPMILVRALQANVQFLGQFLNSQLGESMPALLGVYVDGFPVSGFFYFLAPIQSPQDWMWWAAGGTQEVWQILIRVGLDLGIMIIGGAVFALFWTKTANMGPDSVAKQIHGSGMQVPGFRRNPQVLEKVLERYIPQVTVLGGAIVGLLAVMANMLGTIGGVTGTGLLLMVSITYKLYEEIAKEQMMEMYPMIRDLFS
jgi:preprotein translocase subunit SecY